MSQMAIDQVIAAQGRISHLIHRTPLLTSTLLNNWLGHNIIFKAECLQRTGAFKIRGAINVLAKLAQQNELPQQIVANSSGNHAQGVAYAAQQYGVPATIYTLNSISTVKAAATAGYGATLKTFTTRVLADEAVAEASREPDTMWIPPFDHPDIIAGQGTATLEALQQMDKHPDAIFSPCGGGGLVSGALVSARAFAPKSLVIGCEPLAANDAANSLRAGRITPLTAPAITLADGAATPSVGRLTFPLLQQLDDFFEVSERSIQYWTQWLQHILKLHVEPTSAMCMAGVTAWLAKQQQPRTVLVILSGGNLSKQTMDKIWADDHLATPPTLSLSL